LILRLFGVPAVAEHSHVHSPEEIVMLVEESSAGGVLDQEERRLLINTLQLRNRTVRRVMVPRNRMLAASVDQSPQELLHLLANSPYSRLPLYEGSVDTIVGIVHVKDLLYLHYQQRKDDQQNVSVRSVMHPALFVPESIQIEEVIAQMQKVHQNVAIVVDEHGGTAGLLAFEDLMEEIIGDFQDEFDTENPPLRLVSKNQLIVRGEVDLDDLNQLLDLHFASEDVDTIGGLVVTRLGKIPEVGERVVIDDMTIRVERMDQKRVAEVSLVLTPAQYQRLQEMTNE
jgi:putative hemolysin